MNRLTKVCKLAAPSKRKLDKEIFLLYSEFMRLHSTNVTTHYTGREVPCRRGAGIFTSVTYFDKHEGLNIFILELGTILFNFHADFYPWNGKRMNQSSGTYRLTQISVWIQEGLLLLACFLYLLLYIHPVLIIEAQSPVFFMTADFLNEFLVLPGGLTDWLSALIMQFWFSDLIISLLLTFCFWLVMVLTKEWMGFILENRSFHSFHFIPAGLLLVFHSQYDFHFSMTAALIINLLVLTLILRWTPKKQIVRTLLGLAISLLLYWMTGGASFLFAVLFGLNELIRKRFISGALVLFVSGIFPFITSRWFILVPLKYAYVHNLTFELPMELWYAGYLLPAFFLVTWIIASLVPFIHPWKLFRKIHNLAFLWKLTAGTVLLLGGTILLSKESMNVIKRQVFLVNRAVTDERWSDVLSLTKNCANETPLMLSQSNLALQQTGKLLDSMFAYPQSKGTLGLLMNLAWCTAWPEETSNITWKLGLINESLHWAHEALEHKGPTPDILKRLGMVYMMKGENIAADHFFLNLATVPFQRKTAENLLRLNEDPTEFSQDSTCKYIQSCMLIEDLVSGDKMSSLELEQLVKQNPKNKMAFEYLIAYHLLNANINGVWNHLPDFKALNYVKIPRHVQEALIVIAAMTPKFDPNILKGWVDPITFEHFAAYRKILAKYNGDRNGARQELQVWFGDTYWYYMMFIKSAPRLPEKQNEYQ